MLVHDVGFAAAMMSRLGARPVLSGPALHLAVVEQRPGIHVQRTAHHHHWSLHLALRLAASAFNRSHDPVHPQSPPPLLRQDACAAFLTAHQRQTWDAGGVPTPAPLRWNLARSVGRIWDDTYAGSSRVGPGAPTARWAAPRASLLAGVTPLRSVLRTAPDARSERRPPSDRAAATTAHVRTDRTLPDVTRAPHAIVDVNGLTDQVIRAIDRRIIARRERLGRP